MQYRYSETHDEECVRRAPCDPIPAVRMIRGYRGSQKCNSLPFLIRYANSVLTKEVFRQSRYAPTMDCHSKEDLVGGEIEKVDGHDSKEGSTHIQAKVPPLRGGD